MQISKYAKESIDNLKTGGIRFDIVAKVGHVFELFQIRERGTVRFVAEVNEFGQITEWGDHLKLSKREASLGNNNVVINADGELVN